MFTRGPRVTNPNPPHVQTPSVLDLVNGTLTAEQLIYVMVKFLHVTRDFSGKCDNSFHYCTKSRLLMYKLFGKGVLVEACVPKNYEHASYTMIRNWKREATHTIKFSKEQQKLVKLVCEYKRQFDGWGDDPKCVTSFKEIPDLKRK
jgi:hypothetical protein